MGKDVLISAPYDDTTVSNAGAVYLFDASTGKLLHKFLDPKPVINGHFGLKVVTIGKNVLINAPKRDKGVVYLFDGSTGKLLQTFHNPAPVKGDFFGFNIASVENNVLIKAMHAPIGPKNAGVVYLFRGSTGELLQVFQNPMPTENDFFGCSITGVSNNILVGAIGAMGGNTVGSRTGAVYLFEGYPYRYSGKPAQESKLRERTNGKE